MKFSLPHKYVATPAWVIASAFQARPEKRALLGNYNRLLSLSWDRSDKSTPSMREEDCYEFLGLKRRQFFEIIKEMEGMHWLRSERPRPGFVQFFFHGDDPSAENRIDDAKNRTSDPIVVVVKDSNDSEIKSTTTVLNGEASAKNRTDTNEPTGVQMPTVVQILEQTPLLFGGAVVMSKGLEDRDPHDVLRWCAYVYSQKRTMTAPGGVVRNKLKWNEKPPEWTADKWFETLPNNFLSAIGLLEENIQPEDPEREDDAPQSIPSAPEESVNQRLNDGKTMSPAQAWQAVQGQLQMEMQRASFETWVRDAQAIRYDSNVLTVGVANQYTADWLESRLTSTINRLLIGILNAEVSVEFVVGAAEVVS